MYTEQYYVTWTDADGIVYLEQMTISSQSDEEFHAILRENHVALVGAQSLVEMRNDPAVIKTFED